MKTEKILIVEDDNILAKANGRNQISYKSLGNLPAQDTKTEKILFE
ncbi:MAG: hypothetical protein OEZ22_01240 [Spirochaetia bacterium]|nr:hypothetical protein [Spirochaetia bacterium]